MLQTKHGRTKGVGRCNIEKPAYRLLPWNMTNVEQI